MKGLFFGPLIVVSAWLLGATKLAGQVSIEWSSDLNSFNFQSDLTTPLDADFEFVLGAFEGIIPDETNLAQWETSFRPFGVADYDEGFRRFSNSETLSNNDPPFTTNSRAYIWGRNGLGSGSEWILIGREEWTWPQASVIGPPPFPTRFFVNQAAEEEVIFGSINQMVPDGQGGQIEAQMVTARVEFSLSYENWVAEVFDAGESLTGQEDDPDGDGFANFYEYATGTDPQVFSSNAPVVMNADFTIEISRVSNREVRWELWQSETLQNFERATSGFSVQLDEPERLVFSIDDRSRARVFFQAVAVSL